MNQVRTITIVILFLTACAVAIGYFQDFMYSNAGLVIEILVISNLMTWAALVRNAK